MGRRLRWVLVAVAAFGLAVAVGGFAYDLAYAGLPYQDPTPEMEACWRYHSEVASVIELSGVAILFFGLLGLAGVDLWSSATRDRTQGLESEALAEGQISLD